MFDPGLEMSECFEPDLDTEQGGCGICGGRCAGALKAEALDWKASLANQAMNDSVIA
jgi:hypothetical protein